LVQSLNKTQESKNTPIMLLVGKGDSIVFEINPEEMDLNDADEMLKRYSEAYPDNNIICTFKNMIEVKGVIKKDAPIETFENNFET
jgi:hypothetical protein